ncbi:TniB family NTP-binding protein [Sinorhizobium meliloti]|uniref:TniB family NTP-binding protein n=1 Tax=Rhizobium meliloti TaxID=382 RepID=UPI0013E38772|nr:TniB family NTP-binding protein [Sinorhizobium meliloti]
MFKAALAWRAYGQAIGNPSAETDEQRIRAIRSRRWGALPGRQACARSLEPATRMPSLVLYGDSGVGKAMIMKRFRRPGAIPLLNQLTCFGKANDERNRRRMSCNDRSATIFGQCAHSYQRRTGYMLLKLERG